MPSWLITGLVEAAAWITAVFVFGYLVAELQKSPARRRGGKYAGFVRHRAPVQFSQPRPTLTVMQVRCEWGLHLVEPSELARGEGEPVPICQRCKHLRDHYPTTGEVA